MMNNVFRLATYEDKKSSAYFLNDGIINIGNYRNIEVFESVWSSGPLEDRSWLFAIHSFLHLDCLILTGYGDEVSKLVKEWEIKCSDLQTEFPWHDHATALRLDRLSHMASVLPQCRFLDLAARHAEMLVREEFYSRNTNHGFDQAVSLIIASVVFDEHPEAHIWRDVGLKRLKHEIEFAFTPEGIHVENSPGYHAGMVSNLFRAKSAVEATGNSFDIDLLAIGDGAVRFLAWMTRPDRFLVYLGDTTQRRGSVSEHLSGVASYPELQYALTGGISGSPPVETTRIFEKSGYAAYRSNWRLWAQHVHIVMKCGHLSQYHRHDDDLNVLVHGFGEDWLIDSGLYSHNQSDPVRQYMRSPQAHNVPFFPSLKPRRAVPSIGAPSLKEIPGAERAMGVRGETRMYPGIVALRDLIVYDQWRFRIRDRFRKSDAAEPCFWLFHVPADKKVTVSTSSARLIGRRNQLIIRTPHVGDNARFTVHRGLDGVFPAVFSPKMNVKVNSQVIVFGPSSTQKIDFTFEFDSI